MIDTQSVRPTEPISRFVLEKKKCRTSDGKVKWSGFMPKDGQTSVYRTDGLQESTIWEIGNEFVLGAYTGPDAERKKVVGRGDLLARAVIDQKLSLSPDPAPHPRHANIVGWPEAKEDKVEIAKELERESELVLNPNQ